MKELQEFNDIWDDKMQVFENHAADLQNTLASRHRYRVDILNFDKYWSCNCDLSYFFQFGRCYHKTYFFLDSP